MSAAALPPRQPLITDEDRKDPLFPEYQRHRASMSAQLVEADGFADWKRHRQTAETSDQAAAHPSYPEFLAWMRREQGGARKCPAGDFPRNFEFWLTGGRW
jgi:hypothetical protein